MISKSNKLYLLVIVFLFILFLPRNSFEILNNYNYTFKFISAVLLLYCYNLGINQKSIMIALCIISLNYKIRDYKNILYPRNIRPVLKPFGNRGMFYNMDINSKFENENKIMNYNHFLKNVKYDLRNGKYFNNQLIPKHHDFRNKNSLDRLLKLESEITKTNSKEEKFTNWDKNYFKYLQN